MPIMFYILIGLFVIFGYTMYIGIRRNDLKSMIDLLERRKQELEYKLNYGHSNDDDAVKKFLEGELAEVEKELKNVSAEYGTNEVEWIKKDFKTVINRIKKFFEKR